VDRVVGVFLHLGVRTIRLTGGEPLVRRELQVLVEMLAARGVPDLSLTTNGVLLAEQAERLARAGLCRINVSVDSLLRHRFAELTRRDALDAVMDGLRAAEAAGLAPIKLNCVVIRGTNEDEVVDFARFARATGYDVRFIEFMPLDADQKWTREQVVTSREILAAIGATFPLVPAGNGVEPAVTYRFADGAPGSVGVIASVTEPFCDSCNRLRITADGQLRNCLFALGETDLRSLVRGGASDAEIETAIRGSVAAKWAGHKINDEDFVRPARSMSLIGG
jgi:cyclic pyranopterin phosphate synthase